MYKLFELIVVTGVYIFFFLLGNNCYTKSYVIWNPISDL